MDTDFGKHCEEASLELYALGRLDEANVSAVEEHILICEACRVRLDEADRFAHAMTAGASRLRKESERYPETFQETLKGWMRMPSPVWAMAAVAVCLAAVIAPSLLRQTSPLNDAPYSMTLTAERGNEQAFAPAGRRLDLALDARGLHLSNAKVELVDINGKVVDEVISNESNDLIAVHPHHPLDAGSYFIRVFASSTDPVREYSLSVK